LQRCTGLRRDSQLVRLLATTTPSSNAVRPTGVSELGDVCRSQSVTYNVGTPISSPMQSNAQGAHRSPALAAGRIQRKAAPQAIKPAPIIVNMPRMIVLTPG